MQTRRKKQRHKTGQARALHGRWGTRLFFALLVFLIAPARAADLPRVVSLNLCADAYLMAFADKAQVLALTPQSRDASLSAFHAAAQHYPISDGQIESIAALDPDLVIVSSYSDPMRNRLIAQLGYEVLVMDAADNYAAARASINLLGAAIGREEAARDYGAELDAEMAALVPSRRQARILPLQRRNLTAGRGHIIDEIISRAGGLNLGAANSHDMMSRVSLEGALVSGAAYILLNEDMARPDSRGMEFLTHPALRAAYPPAKRLTIDNNLLVCAGATTPRAVKKLIDQLGD